MPGPSLVQRLGLRRPDVLERCSQAADSGYWLALRFSADATAFHLARFAHQWADTGLLPITVMVLPRHLAGLDPIDEKVEWLAELTSLTSPVTAAPLMPAAAKGAEGLCREFRGSLIALDESVPDGFVDRCFSNQAERDKSFVRCAKALMAGIAAHRVERVQLWTCTPRVISACRTAAHNAGLYAGGAYEFCVPEVQRTAAERLLREGETVRLEFQIDRVALDRAVAR